ncbi:Phosphate regulon sensor protein PhoR [invertebrate metagenome]|uniref:histidine kinase n=1 Tax=invertebrate metagenome TaxID=1711999 RepID=A0A2H9T4C7_9ZZZZ
MHALPVLGIGFLLGLAFNHIFAGLTMALVVQHVWGLYQLKQIIAWLQRKKTLPSGQSRIHGLWLDIFYQLQKRRHESEVARLRLEHTISRIRESASALNDGVIMLDQFSTLEWWNKAAEQFIGLKAKKDKNLLITNRIKSPDFVAYFSREVYKEPIDIVSPVDPEVRLQVTVTVYGANNKILLIRNITRLHQLEKMRKDFVANVSHELRTPLTVFSGYVETLLDYDNDIPVSYRKRALHSMQEQTIRMQSLVNDLLLLSQLESDKDCKNIPVHLVSLLTKIIDDAKAISGENQHEILLRCPFDIQILGNKKELRSALSNLIYNAVRYTPAGGRIRIRWQEKKNVVRIIVEDNGIGIDPIHIPRLTERFYRVDKSRSLTTGGTGLGLAIVKHVLLRHEGQLIISSKPGKGSRFICQFPKNKLILLQRNLENSIS